MNTDSKLYLKQIEVGPMENFIYLVGDREKKQCVMIDPAWDVDSVLKIAQNDGMEVVAGLITHTHFDHCNGAPDLLAKTKSKIYVHKNEAAYLKGMKDSIHPTQGGDKLKVGDFEFTFLHTPGHTPGSQCFMIQNHLVSGDTLFINACGRCDMPGGDARQMYESLQTLGRLAGDTVLLPGHNYGAKPVSTIEEQKRTNPYYQYGSLQEFLSESMG